jgi:hypothetical protein
MFVILVGGYLLVYHGQQRRDFFLNAGTLGLSTDQNMPRNFLRGVVLLEINSWFACFRHSSLSALTSTNLIRLFFCCLSVRYGNGRA